MKFDFADKRLTSTGFIAVLIVISGFSIFGRSVQRFLEGGIGSSGIGVLLASLIGVVLLLAAVWIVLRTSFRRLPYLLGVGLIAGGMMFYVAGNPERWYHLPLFGTVGFLSAELFELRTGAEVAAAIAFFDEFLQFFLPRRTGSVEDVFINAVSAGLGITIWFLIQPQTGDGERSDSTDG